MTIRAKKKMAVDQIARDNASEARAMIVAHERVCEERAIESHNWRISTTEKLQTMFDTLNSGHKSISKSVDGLYARFWTAALSAISLLLVVAGYLIKNHGL